MNRSGAHTERPVTTHETDRSGVPCSSCESKGRNGRLVSPRGWWKPLAFRRREGVSCGRVRRYRLGAHTKFDLKVHLVWIPKYRKKALVGPVAIRVRDVIRQIAIEHEFQIISGRVARDHVHVLVSYRPYQDVSSIAQWLKGISSRVLLQEYAHLRKQFWGRHFWARGYLAVSTGNITDEMIKKYIEEQEGEPIDEEGRFQIDTK